MIIKCKISFRFFDLKRDSTPCKFKLRKIEFLFYVRYKNSPNTPENIMKMQLINYSDRSFVLFGEDTRNHKDLIKSLGGKWNGSLTNPITNERFGGWIFSNKNLNVVYEILGNYITEDLSIYQPSAPELPRVVVKPINMYIIYNIIFLCFVFMLCYIIG